MAVSEHAVLLILAVHRKIAAFHQNVAAGRWHTGIPRIVDILELEGKTVGIVGLGNIGEQTARRLRPFDCNLVYYDIAWRSAEEEQRLGVRFVPFETLLETSDVVSLHVPLNDSTRHMIDAEALGRMKPKSILINTCRGEVVDEVALTAVLRNGKIWSPRSRAPGGDPVRGRHSSADLHCQRSGYRWSWLGAVGASRSCLF